MNINQLMKQAQNMQKKMAEVQEKLAAAEFTGSSGGGAIKLILSGKGELKALKLDPELVNKDEVEILEDLIIAAFNDAKRKLDDQSQNDMSGMLPPGMKLPF